MMNKAIKKNKELREMFAGQRTQFTGMGLDEALLLVLELARMKEFDDVGDFNFEWSDDHAEACGVVDKLHSILTGDDDDE
jgi:hypothetical protein